MACCQAIPIFATRLPQLLIPIADALGKTYSQKKTGVVVHFACEYERVRKKL